MSYDRQFHDAAGEQVELKSGDYEPHQSNGDLFSRFSDLSLDLFCIARPDGCLLRVNPNFTRVLGYAEPDVLAGSFLDFVHPDDQRATATELERRREELDLISFRNRFRDAAGRYRVLEWTAQTANRLLYAAARDISVQVRLEEEIRHSRHREREILNHTPAVIYVKGIDHRYQFVNRQFAEMFNLNQEEIIGRTDFDIFPREIAQRFVANDTQVADSRLAVTTEEQAPLADGLHSYISVKFPLLDDQESVYAVAGISTDISDRLRARAAEQELQLAHVFQRTLYPDTPPQIAGLEIAGSAFPVSHVCGDYYDYIPLPNQQIAIALGDVAGHGYKPALQMVELRSSLRLLLQMAGSLQAAVEKLNEILCTDFIEVPSFVSFFLAHIDVPARTLHYIGAGHDAFIMKADGRVLPLGSLSMVLGVRLGESYVESLPIEWLPGDTLVVFTDGFNEALNHAGEQFGKARVLEAMNAQRSKPAREMIDGLFQCLIEYVGDVMRTDDMTVVVVKATA